MFSLQAKIRKKIGRKTEALRKKGILPAVLYGSGIKNLNLEINEKEFIKTYKEAGESSLISLKVKDNSQEKDFQVLIHQVEKDPLTEGFLHIDLYCPSLEKEIEVEVPLMFKNESLAARDLGGILVKEVQKVTVKGLARNLPREIEVDVGKLKTFEDRIAIKDLILPKGVTIQRDKEDIVALVVLPAKEEEIVKEEVPTPTPEKEEGGEMKEVEKEKK